MPFFSFFISHFFFVFHFPFLVVPRSPLFVCLDVFGLFLVSLSSLFFRFPALLGGGFCSFVSVLNLPCAACEPASLRIPLVCCLLSFLALLIFTYYFFFSSFPIFRFRFGRHLFRPVLFLWALFMLSPRFRFLLCLCSSL